MIDELNSALLCIMLNSIFETICGNEMNKIDEKLVSDSIVMNAENRDCKS